MCLILPLASKYLFIIGQHCKLKSELSDHYLQSELDIHRPVCLTYINFQWAQKSTGMMLFPQYENKQEKLLSSNDKIYITKCKVTRFYQAKYKIIFTQAVVKTEC